MSATEWTTKTFPADRPSTPLELSHASTARALVVVVPERRFLVIQGAGSRDAADFRAATAVLRAVADRIRTPGPHARGPNLEVCWALDPGLTIDELVETLSRSARGWRQMLELPASVTEPEATAAIDATRRFGGRPVPLVRLVRINEGRSAQILRLWTDPEPVSVRRLYQSVADEGLHPAGDLHEIVVADPVAVGAIRGRSILRVPVAHT